MAEGSTEPAKKGRSAAIGIFSKYCFPVVSVLALDAPYVDRVLRRCMSDTPRYSASSVVSLKLHRREC
jgi:hypothetical protein